MFKPCVERQNYRDGGNTLLPFIMKYALLRIVVPYF